MFVFERVDSLFFCFQRSGGPQLWSPLGFQLAGRWRVIALSLQEVPSGLRLNFRLSLAISRNPGLLAYLTSPVRISSSGMVWDIDFNVPAAISPQLLPQSYFRCVRTFFQWRLGLSHVICWCVSYCRGMEYGVYTRIGLRAVLLRGLFDGRRFRAP